MSSGLVVVVGRRVVRGCGVGAGGGWVGAQPTVWRDAAVLRRRWPPSPCRGAAVDCVLLLGGVAGAALDELCFVHADNERSCDGLGCAQVHDTLC